jgi:Plasmid encoded RepA protein
MANDPGRQSLVEADEPSSVLFQHTVLCQTCLPYRDPGPEVRLWQRSQGAAHLRIEAGCIFHPGEGAFIDVGLPFGPKPRLILAHLNAEALRTGSPEIRVESSLTGFVGRLRLDRGGRTILTVKDQLTRLAAAEIRMALAYGDGEARQVQAHIIGEFDLWLPKDERQRVLWPAAVTLDPRYFASLSRHAVPLEERALAALAHNAMALDVYTWLAQRLHRIDPGRPQLVSWAALRDQFGWGYGQLRKFRQVFKQTLETVLTQYRGAHLDLTERGVMLYHSLPPVTGRYAVVRKP